MLELNFAIAESSTFTPSSSSSSCTSPELGLTNVLLSYLATRSLRLITIFSLNFAEEGPRFSLVYGRSAWGWVFGMIGKG